jgi:hypothetical protein
LRFIGLKIMHIDDKLARAHYAVHAERPFFASLVQYIASGPARRASRDGAQQRRLDLRITSHNLAEIRLRRVQLFVASRRNSRNGDTDVLQCAARAGGEIVGRAICRSCTACATR